MNGSPSTPRFLSVICLLVLTAGVVLALLSGCHSSEQNRDRTIQKVFRLNLGTEPPDLDPAKMTDLTSFTVIIPMMKGLTRFDQQMKAAPAMAERWERSADGLTYTFHLRKDGRWSDGQPVTAHDFAFAWERALQPETASDYAFFLFDLKNAKGFNSGKITDFSQVGVRVVDDHTLTVKLERPIPFFPDLMASPIALPLRRDMLEKHGSRFTEAGNFITNGAYKMTRWAHEEKIVLTPNPYFYGPPPKIDAIEMYMINDANTSVVMYENDELDFIETTTSIPAFDVRRLRKSPDYHHGNLHRINYIGFNIHKPPFDDVRVRRAFALAMDRSYYPRLMQSGEKPLASWISPGLTGYNEKIGLHFNPAQARQLLAEAGYPDGKGFPKVSFAFRTMYDIQKEAEIAQFLWKKHLNVDVRLENMEWKVLLNRLDEDPPHLFRMGWFVDYPDPDSFMTVFISDSGNNYTGWKDPRYDALVSEAVVTLDVAKRQKLYDAAQRLLLEQDAVMIPLYAAEKSWLVKPRVKNLQINALNLPDFDTLEISPQ